MPEYWRRDVYPRLPGLIRKFGRPFHLYNKQGIIESGLAINRAFKDIPFRQYFAVKALPEPMIWDFLFRELGFGFDCSSPDEFLAAQAIGAREDDIIYSSNDTDPQGFKLMSEGGCMANLDDITFIPLLSKFPRRIFFRINPGKRLTTPEGNVIGNPYDAKYGITYNQIIPAFKAARRRGAREFGLHIMPCSNDLINHHFVEVARFMLQICAMLYKKLGIRIGWIDIGGGWGVPYRPKHRALNPEWIGQKITKLFLEFAAQFGWLPTLMTECGRYITGPHGILVNPVYHIMQKHRHFIGVAAAMTGCPRPAFYGAYHHIDILDPQGRLRRGPCHYTNVVGPKCENWDRLTPTNEQRLSPKSAKRGDICVTANCGAHSGAMADNYNWWRRLMGILDQDGTNKNTIIIHHPETGEDITGNLVFPRDTLITLRALRIKTGIH
jgi:diaminopimelate decarboxylase